MKGFIAQLYQSPYFWRGFCRAMAFFFACGVAYSAVFLGQYVPTLICLYGVIMCWKTERLFDKAIMDQAGQSE